MLATFIATTSSFARCYERTVYEVPFGLDFRNLSPCICRTLWPRPKCSGRETHPTRRPVDGGGKEQSSDSGGAPRLAIRKTDPHTGRYAAGPSSRPATNERR